jgi:hypothetical protein
MQSLFTDVFKKHEVLSLKDVDCTGDIQIIQVGPG